jgi:hypothetical protein
LIIITCRRCDQQWVRDSVEAVQARNLSFEAHAIRHNAAQRSGATAARFAVPRPAGRA